MPKKEFVIDIFNAIAIRYDKFNHITSLGIDNIWRRRAVKCISIPSTTPDGKVSAKDKLKQSAKILDMACGTGDFSIAIAKGLSKRYPRAEVQIVGGDISQGMLDVMEKKVKDERLDTIITTQLQDGESIGFPDNTFDYVTIAFGIRNFENRELGLKEMLRVLKPQGKLIILELSIPQIPVIRGLFKFYMFKLMPFVGKVLAKKESAFQYLPQSVEKFPQKAEFMDIMRRCGFTGVTHKALSLGICRLYTGEKGDLFPAGDECSDFAPYKR